MYKIYSLRNYKIFTDENNEPINANVISGDIDKIYNELKTDRGYHLYLKDKTNYIIFGDIDHCSTFEEVLDIFDIIAAYFEIEVSSIKYTHSIKGNEHSVHFSIANLNASLKQQEEIFKGIKNSNVLKTKNLDLVVYKHNRWFRLPNQSLKDKPIKHVIIKGDFKDFILDYIPSSSKNINDIGYNEKGIKNFSFDKSIKYDIDDNAIKYLLNSLPSEYNDDYLKWLCITNILKGVNIKGINSKKLWDEWSKNSTSYNKHKNNAIWRGIKDIKFNLNYLVKLVNDNLNEDKQFNPIETYKEFKQITQDYNAEYVNKQYVNEFLTYEDLKNNKTIIIKSCTGSGKTTAINERITEYISKQKHNFYKVLSIVDLITLSKQHLKSFENIGMLSYKNGFIKNNHMTICINSLSLMDDKLTNHDLGQYIVYIDEITSFLKFTHNKEIIQIKKIYNLLLRIIHNCHKLILTDNNICDNIFKFLEARKDDNIKFYINEYQTYQGVKAYRVANENTFLNLLKSKVKKNEPFLFGSDCCTQLTKFYNECIADYTKEEIEQKFILITSKTDYEITDANQQFKDKYVFYSPSLITGVDFKPIDQAQDQFIYIKGNSIDAFSSFQQTCRCRNIKRLFYYCNTKPKMPKYRDVEELQDLYKSYVLHNEIIKDVCEDIDDDYNNVINENSFFELFTLNEYYKDVLKTNTRKHYEILLKDAKFDLHFLNNEECETLDKEKQKQLNNNYKEHNEILFNEFLDAEDKNINKYNGYMETINILNIPIDNDIIIKYKDEITDQHKTDKYFNLIRMLKSDNYINGKLNKLELENYKVKNIDSIYNKIKIVRTLEKQFNITHFDINYTKTDDITIDDNKWALYKKVFRCERANPLNMTEFKPIYNSFINNICGIIKSKSTRIGNDRKQIYSIDNDYIKHCLELNQYINPKRTDFKNYFIELYDIRPNEDLKNNINMSLLDF
jgi:hypothetical protein